MALILNIDTSTDVCSVAIARDGNVIALKENDEGFNHSTLLGVYVDDLLKENDLTASDLYAVAVSMGPGSYTGLRIVVCLAKGICFGAGKPLIAVSTLAALANAVAQREDEEAFYCPMIDARRMEVFTAVYDLALNEVLPNQAMIIDENSFSELLSSHKMFFMGNGADKVKDVIVNDNAEFVYGVQLNAVDMIALSEKAYREGDFLDLAYSTPNYIKKFQTTVPKKNALK